MLFNAVLREAVTEVIKSAAGRPVDLVLVMVMNLDVDLEGGLSTDKIRSPAAAAVHEKRCTGFVALARSRPESQRRWITPRLISKAGAPTHPFG